MADDVLIVGASLAGMRCATGLRRAGFEGRITLAGDEPHRPYDRPPLSKQYLSGEWDADRVALTPDDKWDDLNLDFRPGLHAVHLDPATRTVAFEDGSSLSADALVLATGARPRHLPGTEGNPRVHVLRTLHDATALREAFAGDPKRIVVIGAGFIGAEVAATAHELGHNVTMVEAAAVPMERGLGPEIGAICGQLHIDEGVDVRLSAGVESVKGSDPFVAVKLTDGSRIEADVVVVGIGVVPNTEWMEGCGLEIDNGVIANEFCEVADGVYAAGDVVRWPNHKFGGELMRVEHWENAVEQGNYVGRRIAGAESEPFAPVPWFWSDQYSYKLQLAGRPHGTDEVEIVDGSVEERRFAAIFGRDGKLTGVFGLNRPRHVMQYRGLINDGASWDEALAFGKQ